VEGHFDPRVCSAIEVDQGLLVSTELLFGRPENWPAKVLPIWVNTARYPIPTPQRCWDIGIVLRKAMSKNVTLLHKHYLALAGSVVMGNALTAQE
jgi:protocatechuate 4,5-dioxygenase beta chain